MRIDDLRDALHDQADALVDTDLTGRSAAVRARGRRVRRRRAAGGAALALVALAGGALAVTGLPGTPPEPPVATVLGQDPPRTLTSDGFTFTPGVTVAAEPGADDLEVDLGQADGPRLIAFTSSRTGGFLLASSDQDVPSAGAASGAFSTFLAVDEASQTVTVRESAGEAGRIAAVVYDLSGDLPAGTVLDGGVFRDRVAGAELLAAAQGERGQAEIAVRIPADVDTVAAHTLCRGAGTEVEVRLYAGDGYTSGPCDGMSPLPMDLADSGATTISPESTELVLRAVGSPEALAAVRLTLGVYRTAPAVGKVAGWPVPARTEFAGRAWTLDSSATRTGQRSLRMDFPASDRDQLVVLGTRGVEGTGQVLLDGRVVQGFSFAIGPDSASYGNEVVVPAGGAHSIVVRLDPGTPVEGVSLGLGVHSLAE